MQEKKATVGRRLALIVGAAALLTPLNSTMIAVALPGIREEFGVSVVSVSWLITAYLVVVAIAQPIGGRLGDALGSLTVLRAGLFGMAAFSAVAAFSQSYEMLVVTRSLQGVSAAILIPSATAFLRKSVDLERLPVVLGTNGAMVSAGAASGPVVGGLILMALGWRWLFLINIPVVVVVLLLLGTIPSDQGRGRRSLRIDVVSVGALVTAFAGLAFLGSAIQSDSGIYPWIAVGVTALGIAAYVSRFRASGQGVVDLNLFRRFAFARAGAMTAVSNLGFYTTLVALPVYLRGEHDLGAGAIGLLLFSMSMMNVVFAPIGGRVAASYGVRVGLLTGSLTRLAASAGILLVVAFDGTYILGLPLAVVGIGSGLGMAAQQSSGMAAWPQSVAGSAAGTLSLMRYVGSVAGLSLLAMVLGSSPGAGEFTALMSVVVLVGIVNVVLASLALSTTVGRLQALEISVGA